MPRFSRTPGTAPAPSVRQEQLAKSRAPAGPGVVEREKAGSGAWGGTGSERGGTRGRGVGGGWRGRRGKAEVEEPVEWVGEGAEVGAVVCWYWGSPTVSGHLWKV